jgi:hypothetical protein
MDEKQVLRIIKQAGREGSIKLAVTYENLTSLPDEIGQLAKLETLNLTGNQLTVLPEGIGKLANLRVLYLSHNQLAAVPEGIGKLANLQMLYLHSNQLAAVPEGIGNLAKLQTLSLSNNELMAVPEGIGKLANLQKLWLQNNQLTAVPEGIGKLANLQTLDLHNNRLTEVPEALGKLEKLEKLALAGNPLESPPLEIAQQGTEAIRKYFEGLKVGVERALNEVKVLLVGEGGSGKTSLVKRLRKNKHDQNEAQTHGINIDDWDIKVGRKDIRVHFWDFGGQDIMYSTHQFFLSKRSLYVLVLDGRKDEDPEYWLKHIETFGGDSPILVVINKMDENAAFDVNRPALKEKYQGIKGFYRLSCRKNQGVKGFAKELKSELAKVEMIGTTWPARWFDVKTQLEGMKKEKKDFISCDEYRQLCAEVDVGDEDTQDVLVQYLNDLGVAVHFPDLALEGMHVLEPRWLTGAVYKIVNSPLLAESKGVLNGEMLRKILRKKPGEEFSYPRSKHPYIVELMKKFQLCYAMDSDMVLLPDLQDKKRPSFRFDRDSSLRFYFEYDFLPRSIVPWFIVQRHKDIDGELRWRTGVVLRNRRLGARALIVVDMRERKIYINVAGEQRRDFFAHIRQTFHEIHDGFEKMDVKEWVPLPGEKDFAVEYDELIGHELENEKEIFVGKLRKRYKVADLLNGIERPEVRWGKYKAMRKGEYVEELGKAGKLELRAETVIVEKVEQMTNEVINIGNGNTINAPVFIAERMKSCFNTVAEGDAKGQVKEVLRQLLEEVNEAAKSVDEEQAKMMVQDVEVLTKEVSGSKPRREWYELSVKGLVEAAKAVGEVGKPILATVGKLGPLVAGLLV